MYNFIEKTVTRNDHSIINYTWIRGTQENRSICIMLPGLGYTTQRPIFHYATSVCMSSDVDVLHVNYNYSDNVEFKNLSHQEQDKWMYEDVKSVITTVLNDVLYDKFFFLSKSIGTIPMAIEWNKKEFINRDKTYGIWLTPLLKEEMVYNELLKSETPSFFVIGNQDPYFSEELTNFQSNELVSGLVIPNANHGLEVEGDVRATINVAKQVITSIEDFIRRYKA